MGLCGIFSCFGGAAQKEQEVVETVAQRSDREQVGAQPAVERLAESVVEVPPADAGNADPPSTPASAKTRFIFDEDGEVKGLNNSGSKYAADRPVTIQTLSYEERLQLAIEEEEAALARRREREAQKAGNNA